MLNLYLIFGIDLADLFEEWFTEVEEFGEYVFSLNNDQTPDYSHCIKIFQKKFSKLDEDFDYEYDWNLNFSKDFDEDSKESSIESMKDEPFFKFLGNYGNFIFYLHLGNPSTNKVVTESAQRILGNSSFDREMQK